MRRDWRLRDSTHGPGSSVAKPLTLRRARAMRATPTYLECQVETLLRSMHVGRIGQQVVVYGYIADFYLPSAGLVIEADGPHHQTRQHEDAVRDMKLRSYGLETFRITAEQMRLAPAQVAADLQATIARRRARVEPKAHLIGRDVR